MFTSKTFLKFTVSLWVVALIVVGLPSGSEIVSAAPAMPSSAETDPTPAATGSSVSQILDESGAIIPGTDGSFDPKGFKMLLEEKTGKPIFVPSSGGNHIPDGPSSVAACSSKWDSRFGLVSGVDGEVYALAVIGSTTYVGGDFQTAGGVPTPYLAKWNGSEWSTVGLVLDGVVRAFGVSGTNLFIGGDFINGTGSDNTVVNVNRIGKFNTVSGVWEFVGNGNNRGVNARVHAIAVQDSNNVYVGGEFTQGGGGTQNMNYIANCGTSSCSPVGTGQNNGVGGIVRAIAISGSDIYVGGNFTTVGNNVAANRIAKWTGSWSGLTSGGINGVNGVVRAIAASGSDIYVGGDFTSAGGVTANRVAKWNGSWSALGTGMNGIVRSVAVLGTDVYFGGDFTTADGSTANRIAKLTPSTSQWSALGGGITNGNVNVVQAVGTDLFLGGAFLTAGGNPITRIAKWTGTDWQGLQTSGLTGLGVSGDVYAMAISGSDVYIGGSFIAVGGIAVSNVAKWDGSSWSALGQGVDGPVYAMATSGPNVFFGGEFRNAGGSSAKYVARWNGTWNSLGNGTNLYVWALAVSGSDLYVGGDFFEVGNGISADQIAKWNITSSTWSSIGDADGTVLALAVSGTDLYVGGFFTQIGGVSANRIAKFNTTNSTWSALGSGMSAQVLAIAVSGTDVYVGGPFTTAGGVAANRIAKWDGSTWSALGTGLNGAAFAIAVSGTDVYVGGNFTTAGGTTTNRIAKWNSGWTGLDDGMNQTVYALAVTPNQIYAAGDFTTAGCFSSSGFGRFSVSLGLLEQGDNDWHNSANWEGGSLPDSGKNVVISRKDVTIASSNAESRDLQINRGRKLTIEAGRKLVVHGTLTIDGEIDGDGVVEVLSDDRNSVQKTGTSYIKSGLARRTRDTLDYDFPVGTANGYSPINVNVVTGTKLITVKANQGSYSSVATGLPSSRIPRWWSIEGEDIQALSDRGSGVQSFSADVTFFYPSGEITLGNPAVYKAWRISGGTATNMGGFSDLTTNSLIVQGISQFSDWTLASGRATAAPAAIEGRVFDASGRPVANASVLITKPDGNTVTVKTNNFGRYRFAGIVAGETYLVMAQTRWNLYMPQVVTTSNDLAEVDFRP